METKPPQIDLEEALADSGQFSNFFQDVSKFWNAFGTPIVGGVAIFAIIFGAYNFFTQRAEAARQNAWIDLYSSTSPESLELVIESTKNQAVRAVANLRAADLLLAESNTAEGEDAQAILATAAGHYQQALDEAPHIIYKLNALDGLGVVAESRYETEKAKQFYEQLKSTAGEAYPAWVAVAEKRLELLPNLSEAVVFAPEATDNSEISEDSDATQDSVAETSSEAESTSPAAGSETPAAGQPAETTGE